jgi:inosose dehydratase
MKVPIGINPLTWSNDDLPALGGDIPLETCLREAAQAGYAGIELGNKFPRDAEVLRPLLDRHGLRLVSGWYGGELLRRTVREELAAVGHHLALLSALGCEVMVFAETGGKDFTGPLSGRPRLREEDWPRFCGRLNEVAEALRARGVRMAYHHHMGTVIQTGEEIDRLLAGTGEAVGLLLDTGHLAFAGGDVQATARRHARRINHVHCKDVRPDVLEAVLARDASFLDAVPEGVFTVPGDGCIDYVALCATLEAAGYGGWLVVEAEQDPAKAHPLTYARMGYACLSRLVDAGGR